MDKILNLQKERRKRRKETLKKLLLNVQKRIEYYASSNHFDCLYQLPVVTPGLPIYDNIEALEYIKKHLIDEGFKVLISEYNILYISWKNDDVVNNTLSTNYSEDISKKRKKRY